MHPIVKPALRRGWRDLNTVQFGMAPAHAIILGPVDTATGAFLDLLNGTRGLPLLRDEGRRMGFPDGHVDGLLERLARSGLLDDTTGGGPAADALRKKKAVLDRLRPDLASLSLVAPEPGEGMKRLAARRSLRVQVRGAGRVGVALASLLMRRGRRRGRCPRQRLRRAMGHRTGRPARRVHRRAPGGSRPARRAPIGTGPSPRTTPDGEELGLSLVILTPRDGLAVHAPDPVATEPLITSGTPHLYAGVVEGTGVVGPLVLPGDTGCAGCLDQGRVDRDPTWPRLVAQWRSGQQRQVPACDLALAAGVAGMAAGHALAFLDGGLPSSAGARWEASVPGFDWHSRPVWSHPACPCGAAEKGKKGERASEDGESHETMAGQQPYAARLSGTWRAHV